jgi:probable phosphoglycerate mutase
MKFNSLALVFASLGLLAPANPVDAATFLFIRHAESTTNAGTATTPEELVDPPLTELGKQQAQDLAVTLAGIDLTTIYVSSFQRTALTIEPTAQAFGLTPNVVPEIREWSFGSGPLDNSAIGEMFNNWLGGDTSARIAGVPDSESLDELNARVVPAYQEIIGKHAN